MFTKGEWKVAHLGRNSFVLDKEDNVIAEVKGYTARLFKPDNKPQKLSVKANAHLIAAAPDLYEALVALFNSDLDMSAAVFAQVQQALSKAEGNYA